MSTFEFVSVLLSIVVGLGLTRLLTAVGRAVEIRRDLRFYWVQGVWVMILGLLFITFWWATLFSHSDRETWTFPNFMVLLFYAIFLFLASVLLIPSDFDKGVDLEAHFFEVRPWFFSFLALAGLTELADTYMHGGWGRVLSFGPYYLLLVSGGITCAAAGALTRNRFFHAAAALAFLVGLAGWMLVGFWSIGG